MLRDCLFTSESVSEGHPDKVCDRVSDAILDAFLQHDPDAHVAVEALVTEDRLALAGAVRGSGGLDASDLERVARQTVREIGYEQPGFHWRDLMVSCWVHAQSPDIARGVERSDPAEQGAGDQGIMFGFACDETPTLMPAPIHYAHEILHSLAGARHSGSLSELGPDAKSQVTLVYEDGRPVRADSVVVSAQHHADVSVEDVRALVHPFVAHVLPEGWMPPAERFYVNPTGRFVVGGPAGDSGVTGRKIIVDTYGGAAPHGGGCFSGKDPSKVDRSATYAARYLAKNVVAAGLARRCLIQISYAIGVADPLSLYVDTEGTGRVDDARLARALRAVMDLRPAAIVHRLGLKRPIYARTAAYGHFGRAPEPDGGFSWERTDLAGSIKAALT